MNPQRLPDSLRVIFRDKQAGVIEGNLEIDTCEESHIRIVKHKIEAIVLRELVDPSVLEHACVRAYSLQTCYKNTIGHSRVYIRLAMKDCSPLPLEL